MTENMDEYNWVEYNTYSDSPVVYATFCCLLGISTLIPFKLYKDASLKKKEIREPTVNRSYSKISIYIITWVQINLVLDFILKIIQIVAIAMNTKFKRALVTEYGGIEPPIILVTFIGATIM